MKIVSVADLTDELRRYRLLETPQLAELPALQARLPKPMDLARELLKRGWLTPYQANQLLQGRGQELLLGSYVLLERLGEGGMGQVFKARNWKLGRVVALKLIRKERLDNEDSLRRFHRESRAAAQLDHPNIVHAYDADEANGTHFFVMEHVEGADLAKLVKRNGPLPVAQACDWVRQAAMGLQHAHERGLVHRDIKPHNLLLNREGVVKILDMGLARLDAGCDGEESSTMTQEGAVMGTPDFLAPEQARDAHTVDIRADVYSLGCTLYYLLTGKVPFPGGSLGQKLWKQQMSQPTAVEQLRPDIPPTLAAVVRRAMAKRPEDRFQTPRELALALDSPPAAILAAAPSRCQQAETVVAAAAVPQAMNWAAIVPDPGTEAVTPPSQARPSAARRVLYLAAGGAVVCLFLLAIFVFRSRPREPSAAEPSQSATPPVRPSVSSEVVLFNGKDLTGWEGQEDIWEVKEGAIIASSYPTNGRKTNTFLCTKRTFKNFELHFLARVRGGNNSGVMIRGTLYDRANFWPRGIKCDLGQGASMWGNLVRYDAGKSGSFLHHSARESGQQALKRDEFNACLVRCVGHHIVFRLNGVAITEADVPELAAEGVIAFQLHFGGPVEVAFKDIRLTPLNERGEQ